MAGRRSRPGGPTVRPALVIALASLRSTYRRLRGSARLRLLVASMLGLVGWSVVNPTGEGALYYGRLLARGEVAAVTETVRTVAVTALFMLVLLSGFRSASNTSKFKHRTVALVTATRTRTVVLGILLSEVLFWPSLVGVVVVAGAAAFAVGSGAPASALSLTLGGLWVLATVPLIAYPVGFGVRWVFEGYDLSRNARLLLGVATIAGFEVLVFNRGVVEAALLGTPVAWYGDLLLLTVPGAGANPAYALAALAGTGGLALAGTALATVAAGRVWFRDAAFATAADDPGERPPAWPGERRGRRLLRALVGRPAAPLVALTWRTALRRPKSLLYVGVALFVGGYTAYQTVLAGPLDPALLPALSALFAALAAGSGPTLHPLDSEGDALPAVLTAPVTARALVRGKALAAWLPGATLGVGAATASAAVAGLPWSAAGLFALAALALALGGPALALAIGTRSPPGADSLLEDGGGMPAKSASLLYTVTLTALALPTLVGAAAFATAGALSGLAAGVGVTVAASALLGAAAYRHAVGNVAAYSVD